MAYDIEERDRRDQYRHSDVGTGGASARHQATVRARVGPAALHAKVRISTRGLLAVTALVACTLLSTAAIVAVATRKLPEGAMPARMKRSRW